MKEQKGTFDITPDGGALFKTFSKQIVPGVDSLLAHITDETRRGTIDKEDSHRLLINIHSIINSINICLLSGLNNEKLKELQEKVYEASQRTAEAVRK